jgi:two-component system CheB/CheR fusion protein
VPVVGVGASAGGLEAISQLIRGLDPGLPYAYVVLQHVSPTHRSMLPEILARETRLTVRALEDGESPQAGVIHVVPPNVNAYMRDGRFSLQPARPEVVPKPSVNDFFISLAAEAGDEAVGIVLSGTGSDGTAGLRAIVAAGGVTLVQDPAAAKYSGMPHSAVEAGVADFVLSAEAMPAKLAELASTYRLGRSGGEGVTMQLLGKLKVRRKIDFSGYKPGTLVRRLRRRMVATGMHTEEDYRAFVDAHPEELDRLARDILISVTAFFRDASAFEALRAHVGTICREARESGQDIRIWVAGCATGEEAYSIAILFDQALAEVQLPPRVQIFATDVDDDALAVARRGLYPAAALHALSAPLLERYFQPFNEAYEVGKRLRDMIVFARHNLIDDPPFLRIDLVACRNVLIYFDTELQARVLKRFHFALKNRGILFLGRSESVGQSEAQFATLDRSERVFRKHGDGLAMPVPALPRPVLSAARQRRDAELQRLLDGVVAHFDATVALCDGQGNVLHTAGGVERVFQFPRGRTQVGVAELIAEPFRAELLSMLHRMNRSPRVLRGRKRVIDGVCWQLSVCPVAGADAPQLLVILEAGEPAASEAAPQGAGAALAELDGGDDLQGTRAQLQSLIEELGTANEEMQSLNEEAQASNEELQATNEELEAANEELQATNEELMSLNEELNVKSGELQQLNDEYMHLYDSLDFPIMVFDREYRLRRFNAPAARQFKLRTTALQQRVNRLKLPEALASLESHLSFALAHGEADDELITLNDRLLQLVVTPGVDRADDVELLVVSLIDVTDITETQAALRASRAQLETLMRNTTILLAMKDLSGKYLFANPSFCEAFGLDQGAILGRNDFDLFPEAFAADIWSRDMEALRKADRVLAEHVLPGDRERILRTAHQILRDADGRPTAIITESEDITLRKQAERQLRVSAKVFEQAGEAIVVSDRRARIQSVNNAFTRITGYGADEAVGRNVTELLRSDQPDLADYQAIAAALEKRGFWQGEVWNGRKSGEAIPLWITINRVEDDGDWHYVAVFSDISRLKASQRQAEYLATHDPLTGLPNRTLFQDRLGLAMAHARRHDAQIAVLFLDLDNFKTINDTLGHDVGDKLLIQVAGRLGEIVREVDTVARLGGDEFTVILNETTLEGAERVAQRIVDELREPVRVDDRLLFVTASVGLAFFPEDGEDASAITKAADTAMYRAKDSGRDRFELFKPELQARLVEQANLESALRLALNEKRLRLVYQPKFTAAEPGRLAGAEVLLRWSDPFLGEMAPADFIPVAERTGLIVDIDRRVVLLAAEALSRWRVQGLALPQLAINVSARSFQEERFLDDLFERLSSYGVSHSLIEVEITERTLVERSSTALGNIERLREAGIALSIDDFGTGYSSLAYLKRLPLAELKIDKSFVDGVAGKDRNDEAIVRAILGMASALDLRTVAEGVETEAQREWLCDQGCDLLQGYLMARPEEEATFVARLEADGALRLATQ